MQQETKMRATIGVGTTLLVIAALFANGTTHTAKEAVREEISEGSVAAPSDTRATIKAAPRTATIALRSASDAGQTGTAILTDLGGNKTRIAIFLTASKAGAVQPANIHAGTCKDAAKEPQYPLSPIVKGTSVTVLNVNMGALIDNAPQSIRVRTDAVTAGAPYAVCGELR